ncbi:hypothetical protein [Anatilimnocola floriformis]|uniref:hypothetical protein n=1 Tax=Anatilimnocola floriformis TaxID=2948575 RepID=UPI0020C30336|nr:hypothetical protein [Anatilimnocola floriformis]
MKALRGCGLILVVLAAFVGCGPAQQTIKVAKGESAAAAIVRVAKSLPSPQAEEFSAAAESLAFYYTLRNPEAVSKSGPTRAIHAKTPAQVIAEYNRLSPESKADLATQIASIKASDKSP